MSDDGLGTGQLRRCRVLVTGRVQGVAYRDACRREANRVGAVGWVRNLPDGSVEAVIEGHPLAVADLVTWMQLGPPRAVVAGLTVEDLEPEGGRGFSILY